ncbi:MAG TPA: MFS transporter [Roseiflexaceae bacterium]|nr:MFS transporter [Roseiflexaceae bacterium]
MERLPPSRTTAQRTLALACAVFLAAGIMLAGLGPTLPLLARQIGQDIAVLGGMFTAISLGIILAQFGAGRASARFGQPVVLAAGMLLMVAGGLGVTLGPSLPALLAGALLFGIGFGGVLAAGNLLVAQLFPARSAAALNGVNLFFGVGSMVGPALAGLAGARLGLPQAALWAGAGLQLALAPIVLGYAARPVAQAAASRAEHQPARPVSGWLLGLLLLIYIGTEVGFSGWLTVYMLAGGNLTPAAAALVVSGFWLALTLGRTLGALLGMRVSARRLLTLSLLGMFSGALPLVLGVGNQAISIAGVLCLGLSCGPVFPTVLAIVATTARNSAATTSLVLAVGNGGGLIVPVLLGVLLTRYGPLAAGGLVLGAALAMLLMCVTMFHARAGRNNTVLDRAVAK